MNNRAAAPSSFVILASHGRGASEARRESAPRLCVPRGCGGRAGEINLHRQSVHRPSTFLPQVFHKAGLIVACVCVMVLASPATSAQSIDAGAVFRVFLTSGQALPSYGESALVGDRVVFTLLVGGSNVQPVLQLLSLPVSRVDVARTRRYANAMRASHYAATRGEVDYAAMTQEVKRALAQLTSIEDPKRRLDLAEQAKQRIEEWTAGTYGYRAADVRELIGLFDEVINELRAAAGQRQFAIDLRTGPEAVPSEPLLPLPTVEETVELALAAASAADGEDDRLAILKSADSLALSGMLSPALATALRREVEAEKQAASAYASLFASVRSRAEEAKKRGDVAGVEAAIDVLRSGDVALGSRRPRGVEAVATELATVLEATRTHRAALDRYVRMRGALLHYERTVRPMMSGFDGLAPIFSALRDMRYTAYERLERASARIGAYRKALAAVAAPEDLADVHASLDSAMAMADHACARRKQAMSTPNEAYEREASSAAAGAIMLATLAREQLVARLYPPKMK